MRRLIPLAAVAVAIAMLFAVTASGAGTTSVSTRSLHGLGKALVNGKSVTLYLFEKDKNNKSNCSGACAQNWPPLMAHGKVVGKGGVKTSHLGTIKRSGGRQVTYFGHPLYTFVADGNKPGSAKGQDFSAFGAKWYTVGTNGKKIDKD
jgi:predicted lipoprotein with Yx(FWY)xxD motif